MTKLLIALLLAGTSLQAQTLRLFDPGTNSQLIVSSISGTGSPVQLTFSAAHGLSDNDFISCHGLNNLPQAVGTIRVKAVISSTVVSLKTVAGVDIPSNGTANLDLDVRKAGNQYGYCGKLGSYTPTGAGWFPFSGADNTYFKDPDGAGPLVAPVVTADPGLWANRVSRVSSWVTIGCDGVTTGLCPNEEVLVTNGSYQTGEGWSTLNLALLWYADNSQTKYLNSAKYLINHMHRVTPTRTYFSACDRNAGGCGQLNAMNDYVSFFIAGSAQALGLLDSMGQITGAERTAFERKILNDASTSCVDQLSEPGGNVTMLPSTNVLIGDTGEFASVSANDKVYVRTTARKYRRSDSTLTSITVSGTTATITVGGGHPVPAASQSIGIYDSGVTNLDGWYLVATPSAPTFTITVSGVADGTYTTAGMYVRLSPGGDVAGTYLTVVSKTDDEHLVLSNTLGASSYYTNAPWGRLKLTSEIDSNTCGLFRMGQIGHSQVAPIMGSRYGLPAATITPKATSFTMSQSYYNNFKDLTVPYYINLNAEIMKVTSMVDGTRTFNVDRAQFQTPAQNHTTTIVVNYNPFGPAVGYNAGSPTHPIGPYYANLIQRHTTGPLSAFTPLLSTSARARELFEYYWNWISIWQRTRNAETWAGGTPAASAPGYALGTWVEMYANLAFIGTNGFSPSINFLSGFPGVENAAIAYLYYLRGGAHDRRIPWADSGTARYLELDDMKIAEFGSTIFPSSGPYIRSWQRTIYPGQYNDESAVFRLVYGSSTVAADYTTLPTKRVFRSTSSGDNDPFMIGGMGFRQSWSMASNPTACWASVAVGDDHTASYPWPGMLLCTKGDAEMFIGATAGGTLGDMRTLHAVEVAVTSTLSMSSIVDSGNVTTITTTNNHGRSVGQFIFIQGASDADLNGYFVIASVPTPQSLTIATANVTDGDYTSGATATGVITLGTGGLTTSVASTATGAGPAYISRSKVGSDYAYSRFTNNRYNTTVAVTEAFRDVIYLDPGSGEQDYIITYDHNKTVSSARRKILRIPFYRYTNTEGAALQSPAPTYSRTNETVTFDSNQYSARAHVKVLYPTVSDAEFRDNTSLAYGTRLEVISAATEADFFTVHQLCPDNSCLIATETLLSSSATHRVGQIDDGTNVWIVGTTKNPTSTATSLTFTTEAYSGDAKHLMTGLNPNTVWDVYCNAIEILSDQVADASGTLRYDASRCTGGVFSLSSTGSVPLEVTTTSLPGCLIGGPYNTQLQAIGGTAPYTWTLSSGSLPSGISLTSTGQISGVCPSAATYNFTVQATDAVAATDTQALSIVVSTPDTPSITNNSLSNGQIGVAYSETLEGFGGTAPYTFTLQSGTLPDGLSLNGSSGAITGTPTTAETQALIFRVTDSTSPTPLYSDKSLPITIDPAPAALSITSSATLPNGTKTIAYSTTFTAAGGMAPYSWSVTSGAFQAGLTLNADGTLTGTPTASGAVQVTVEVEDAAMDTVSQIVTLLINEPEGLDILPSVSTISMGIGDAYSQPFSCDGGTAPYTFSSTGILPSGITFDSSGLLSGTPTNNSIGDFPVSLICADDDDVTANLNVTLRVRALGSDVTISSTQLLNSSLVFRMRMTELDANQSCAVTARDEDTDTLLFGPQTISPGPAVRTVVLTPVIAPQGSSIIVGVSCDSLSGNSTVTYSTVAGTSTIQFFLNGTKPGANNVVVNYGTTTSLGTTTSPVACSGACSVSVASLPKGEVYYFQWVYRDGSNNALATSSITPILVQ